MWTIVLGSLGGYFAVGLSLVVTAHVKWSYHTGFQTPYEERSALFDPDVRVPLFFFWPVMLAIHGVATVAKKLGRHARRRGALALARARELKAAEKELEGL